MKIIRTVVAGLVIAAPAAAWAQTARDASLTNYIDFAAGNGKVSVDCTGSTLCHGSDTAAVVRFGHRFDPSWAVELSYAKVDAGISSLFQRAAELEGYGINAAYTLPVSDSVAVLLRAGAWSNRTTYQPGLGENGSRTATTAVKPVIGLAGSWQFAQHWSLNVNADFTRADLRSTPNSAKDSATVRVLTAGVAFSF